MPKKRTDGNKIKPADIARYNKLASKGQNPMVQIDGQWFSWEESDRNGKEIYVADQDGGDREVSLDQIDLVQENVLPNQDLTSVRSLNEMAKINYDKADAMVGQIMDKYPAGKKRTFILKQILTAMKAGFGKQEKQFIKKANDIVLKYNLDQTDNIPLFRIELQPGDIR